MSKELGLLIFDHLNDVVYIKCNKKFIHHVQSLAVNQGLIWENSSDSKEIDEISGNEGPQSSDERNINEDEEKNTLKTCLDKDIVIQLFSPLVASYRIMKGQFRNPYESISCEDGTKFIFQEYSSHLFLCIGAYSEAYLNRFTNVCIRLSQFILGPCISVLKTNKEKSQNLDCLISAWIDLYSSSQSFLVEGIQRLIVSTEVSSTAVCSLSMIVNSITNVKGIGSGHALFFVRDKLLTLYSSKNAEELLESDILAINLLLKANSMKDENLACMNAPPAREEVLSPVSPDVEGFLELDVRNDDDDEEDVPVVSDEDVAQMDISEYLIFLQTKSSPLAPHIAYLCLLTSELSLVVLAQVNRSLLSGQLVEVFRMLEDLKNEEINVKQTPLIEIVDNSLRNSQDFMKWIPSSSYPKIKKCLIQLCNKWEALKKNDLEEWLRSSTDCILSSRLEAGVSSFMMYLRNTWKVACLDVTCLAALRVITTLSMEAKEKMSKYFASLEPDECLKSMSSGSCSIISINKYLEEFPGLVHFIYIDRSTHQLTAPPLWTSEQGGIRLPFDSSLSPSSLQAVRQLTAAKIWSMVDFARDHLIKGHSTVLWKDKTFSYSYFLWYEDQGGNPLKPINLNKDHLKSLPQPGLLCGDFYKVYATKAFPNSSLNSLRGIELFCVHIGMATSPCILEQTRRLAASIWEIAGPSTNPIELL